MNTPAQELPGLAVSLDRLIYKKVSCPGTTSTHAFVYYLTISNKSHRTVRLFGRKWVVREDNGRVLVVEGDGIIGQNPKLAPGETFSYHSHHLTSRDATAKGCFFGTDVFQNLILVHIPAFAMKVPPAK